MEWKKNTTVSILNSFPIDIHRASDTASLPFPFQLPVFFSLPISTIALPSFFDRRTAQNSKNKLENLR